jgi:hypothetical protein
LILARRDPADGSTCCAAAGNDPASSATTISAVMPRKRMRTISPAPAAPIVSQPIVSRKSYSTGGGKVWPPRPCTMADRSGVGPGNCKSFHVGFDGCARTPRPFLSASGQRVSAPDQKQKVSAAGPAFAKDKCQTTHREVGPLHFLIASREHRSPLAD